MGTKPRWYEVLGVLLVASWARLSVFPQVLIDGVSPSDADAEYHLHRMRLAWETFPRISVFDPLLGWPEGHAHPWAPGFDWFGALLMRLAITHDESTLMVVAALFPVLIGLIVVWLTIDVTGRLGARHRVVPLVAGVIVALIPQFIGASRIGRVDHHVWEAMGMLLLFRWAISERVPAWRFELRGFLAITLLLFGFSGGVLYVALVLPIVVLHVLSTRSRRLPGSGFPALVLASLVLALIDLGPIREHGQWLTFMFPSLLQPMLLGAAAIAVGLALISVRLSRHPVLAFIGAIIAFIVLALILPGIGTQLRAGIGGWLFRKDPWLATIAEFQPMLAMQHPPQFYFGFAGLLAIPAVAFLFIRRRSETLAFVGVCSVLLALTFLQMRFGRVLAPFLGIGLALGLEALLKRPLFMVGAVVLISALDPEVRDVLVLAEPREASPIEWASDQLKLDRPASGDDGVLAPWNFGSTILSRAHRPVIASAFGSYVDPEGFALASKALATDEAALLAVMQMRQLSVVVVGGELFARGRPLDTAALMRRPVATLAYGGSGVPGSVPHLEHLMPIAASPTLAMPGTPVVWIYERVEGATVRVACAAGSQVVATLRAAVGGTPFTFIAWSTCGADQSATIRLAVPSGTKRAGFETDLAWQVGAESIIVTNEMIRSGAAISRIVE